MQGGAAQDTDGGIKVARHGEIEKKERTFLAHREERGQFVSPQQT